MEEEILAQRHIFWIDIFFMAEQDIGSNMEFEIFCIFREQEMVRRRGKYHICYMRIMGHLNFGLMFVSDFDDFNHN